MAKSGKPRTAAQKAATARMIAARNAVPSSGAKPRAKGAKRSKGSKAAKSSKGITHTRGKSMVAFLPLTPENALENQRRMVHALAMLAAHQGHTRAAVERIEGVLVSKGIMATRYAWGGKRSK